MRVWIGIDDTDSRKGMCTTYLALILMERLKDIGEILGFPRIIRLNPTIPFKTRGNGAVSFLAELEDLDKAMEIAERTVNDYAELEEENTNPGVVFVEEEKVPLLKEFAIKAIKDVLTIEDAMKLIEKHRIPYLKFKNGRGLIGALASVGAVLEDLVYELITYRMPDKIGKPREFEKESFYNVDFEFYPTIFDTVDWCNDVVMAVPGTPCPVLFGLRGESVEALKKAIEIVKTEPWEREQIFLTNHATDMHIIENGEVKEFHSYRLVGKVIKKPYEIIGGHVFFEIETKSGILKCSAFEPTKQFRNIVRALIPGDLVEVYGSVKNGALNLEKMRILELEKQFLELNPLCPQCGKRMESSGKGQGFRCRSCKTRAFEKIKIEIPRKLEKGFYEVPPCARRHLTKPLIRMQILGRHIFR
ncbi:MAG: tRNA(Ile)(2)-agmatinylcytidine synthase [Archaeoglobaceae archaeon]|nr:tRNA(Ile)(2)-agmatinylcytidine synthase [Archaeoglobaceae archaeon]MDW8127932.1 tRNA(Ile)(2)-agmatinylcytidine synthase [Archaeoglobaceae archaeon]